MKGTDKALSLWHSIPKRGQLLLLNNVFCSKCKTTRGITETETNIADVALVVTGSCIICQGLY